MEARKLGGSLNVTLSLKFVKVLVGVFYLHTSDWDNSQDILYYGRDKEDKFPLRQIVVEKQMDDFKLLMKNKLSIKFRTV